MKNFLWNLPFFRFLRQAYAAPFFAERCELLQAKIEILELHLAISRAMVATTMKERDALEGALEEQARQARALQLARRQERDLLRTWLTRCLAVHPSEN
jgi:hypothetical protein